MYLIMIMPRSGKKPDIRADITIRTYDAKSAGRFKVVLSMYNGAWNKVSTIGRVIPGYSPEAQRLYFVPHDDGFTIGSNGAKSRNVKTIAFNRNEDEDWKSLVGDYVIQRDNTNDLYYIDLPHPKNGGRWNLGGGRCGNAERQL